MTIRRLKILSSDLLDGLPEKKMPSKFVKKDLSNMKTVQQCLDYRAELVYFWKSLPKRDAFKIAQDIGDRIDMLNGVTHYIRDTD